MEHLRDSCDSWEVTSHVRKRGIEYVIGCCDKKLLDDEELRRQIKLLFVLPYVRKKLVRP